MIWPETPPLKVSVQQGNMPVQGADEKIRFELQICLELSSTSTALFEISITFLASYKTIIPGALKITFQNRRRLNTSFRVNRNGGLRWEIFKRTKTTISDLRLHPERKGALFWNWWKGRFCSTPKHGAGFGARTRLSNCKVLSLWNHIYRTTPDRPFLNCRTPRSSPCHPPERIFIAGMFRQNSNSMYVQYFCYQIAFTWHLI